MVVQSFLLAYFWLYEDPVDKTQLYPHLGGRSVEDLKGLAWVCFGDGVLVSMKGILDAVLSPTPLGVPAVQLSFASIGLFDPLKQNNLGHSGVRTHS